MASTRHHFHLWSLPFSVSHNHGHEGVRRVEPGTGKIEGSGGWSLQGRQMSRLRPLLSFPLFSSSYHSAKGPCDACAALCLAIGLFDIGGAWTCYAVRDREREGEEGGGR